LGALPVPLYPTLGVDATAGIFRDAEAVAVATIGWFRAGVDASVALAPSVRIVVEPNELDSDAPAPPDHPARPDDACFLQYTSGLDLSSLQAALSGAEPVRTSTIDAFESHFGIKNVIVPCYGLAEATLAVAIWPRGVPLRYDASGRCLSVGQPCRGVELRIAE